MIFTILQYLPEDFKNKPAHFEILCTKWLINDLTKYLPPGSVKKFNKIDFKKIVKQRYDT